MKYFLTILSIALFLGCTSKKPVLYNYPAGIMPAYKVEFVQNFEKGKVLYGIHCAKCHSTEVNGQEIIPDFTPVQLDAYDMRLGLTKHQAALTERNVPEEELDLILLFLGHKKQNKTTAQKAP